MLLSQKQNPPPLSSSSSSSSSSSFSTPSSSSSLPPVSNNQPRLSVRRATAEDAPWAAATRTQGSVIQRPPAGRAVR
ncbi:hypothetical protein EYF80_017729 [Liparis tanakae]|uniref:Uncharacterized protein n=1 Tax=Liparis tanakae TaxID=230148 RepID=A0A4Z2I2D7_9TELE|nr:hypothetical protein EYF80_017729 [Liparis tanakae]